MSENNWDLNELAITKINKKTDIVCYDNRIINEDDVALVNIDDSKIVCCGIKKHKLIKRSLLPIIPGGITILVFFDNIRTSFIYFPLIVWICSLILFINYPILVIHSNLRPVYFGNDIFIDRDRLPFIELSQTDKKDILTNIKWLLIILFSFLSAALSDYWLFKTQHASSYFEIFGVTGGILKIFQMFGHLGAGIIMKKTRRLARRKARSNSQIDEVIIELTEINLKHKSEDTNINDTEQKEEHNRIGSREENENS